MRGKQTTNWGHLLGRLRSSQSALIPEDASVTWTWSPHHPATSIPSKKQPREGPQQEGALGEGVGHQQLPGEPVPLGRPLDALSCFVTMDFIVNPLPPTWGWGQVCEGDTGVLPLQSRRSFQMCAWAAQPSFHSKDEFQRQTLPVVVKTPKPQGGLPPVWQCEKMPCASNRGDEEREIRNAQALGKVWAERCDFNRVWRSPQ